MPHLILCVYEYIVHTTNCYPFTVHVFQKGTIRWWDGNFTLINRISKQYFQLVHLIFIHFHTLILEPCLEALWNWTLSSLKDLAGRGVFKMRLCTQNFSQNLIVSMGSKCKAEYCKTLRNNNPAVLSLRLKMQPNTFFEFYPIDRLFACPFCPLPRLTQNGSEPCANPSFEHRPNSLELMECDGESGQWSIWQYCDKLYYLCPLIHLSFHPSISAFTGLHGHCQSNSSSPKYTFTSNIYIHQQEKW